ncbi:hypothetical protein HAX54_033948, partial [Datura stramonium]|nr:hypothetical protein [Datura stramonium]
MKQVPQHDRGWHHTGTLVLWPTQRIGRPRQGEVQHAGMYSAGMYSAIACMAHK